MNIEALFLGAGASTPFGIPTMRGMVTEFEKSLQPGPEKQLYDLINNRLKNYKYFDLESLITVLQNIVDPDEVINDILNEPSIHFYYDYSGTGWKHAVDNVNFLVKYNQDKAESLLRRLKEYLREACTIDVKDDDLNLYHRLFKIILESHKYSYEDWLKHEGQKQFPLDIYITNYDLILEAFCSNNEIKYTNGEKERALCIKKSENPELFDSQSAFMIRKLHGSINWYRDQRGKFRHSDRPIRIGEKFPLGHEVVKEVLLYPIRGLYAYREPFYDLFLDLKHKLVKWNNWLIIGYSFRDKDIAGLFLDAAEINPDLTLCLVGLSSGTLSEVMETRLSGFKGTVRISPSKFNHSNIDALTNDIREIYDVIEI